LAQLILPEVQMLTRADIDDILKLIDASDFQELKLEMGDLKLELRKGGAGPGHTAPIPATPAPPTAVAARIVASGGGSEIPSPLLGTFWHAPRPGADDFVKPGDVVTADTVIGIIEVMKLMNSVNAGVAGTVIELVAPNGELVEHGQTLIRIQPN
jgi:acetyl-CoA carboxylase biotin carboxyl carrier protein